MKKKYTVSFKDKKDWIDFTKQIGKIKSKEKEVDIYQKNFHINKIPKLDLHGFALEESNKMVKKFITEFFKYGYRKLLVVTGKGLRSKSYENPYVSEKLNILRYSIPEFIKNDEDLNNKITSVSKADIKDGGDGAIYIFLNNSEKSIK